MTTEIIKNNLYTLLFTVFGILTAGSFYSFADQAENEQTAVEDLSPAHILRKLEDNLSDIATVKANFIQTKELAVFERTVQIKGEMALQAPDLMAWRVDEPVKYTMIIRGTRLEQWDEDTDKVQRLNLDREPAFKAAFEQMTVWFSGRYSSLAENYNIEVEKQNPYILVFRPRKDTMFEKLIERVRVVFRKDARYIEKLEVVEARGDRTVIDFHDIQLNVPLERRTWEVRFR